MLWKKILHSVATEYSRSMNYYARDVTSVEFLVLGGSPAKLTSISRQISPNLLSLAPRLDASSRDERGTDGRIEYMEEFHLRDQRFSTFE